MDRLQDDAEVLVIEIFQIVGLEATDKSVARAIKVMNNSDRGPMSRVEYAKAYGAAALLLAQVGDEKAGNAHPTLGQQL